MAALGSALYQYQQYQHHHQHHLHSEATFCSSDGRAKKVDAFGASLLRKDDDSLLMSQQIAADLWSAKRVDHIILKPSAKPWSPRNRPESPVCYPIPIIIPEITLQVPPKLDRPKPLYTEMASKKPIYHQLGEGGVAVKLDDDSLLPSAPLRGAKKVVTERAADPVAQLLTPIEVIEAEYEHDEYDHHRRDYSGHRLEEVALSVYEDMKSFEGFARRIVSLPQDSFYELQIIQNIISCKYRHYQRTLHHMIMGKIRTMVEYYMREFAHAYDHVFIGWFQELQKFLTEDPYVKYPYMTHFHSLSFNQFIYRDLMEVIMKLRERIMTVDRHLISPIPTEFIMNSHYNTVRHMIHEEQLNYVLHNLHKIYHAVQRLINHKISY